MPTDAEARERFAATCPLALWLIEHRKECRGYPCHPWGGRTKVVELRCRGIGPRRHVFGVDGGAG